MEERITLTKNILYKPWIVSKNIDKNVVFILTDSNWICTQIDAHIFRTIILRRYVGSSKNLEELLVI